MSNIFSKIGKSISGFVRSNSRSGNDRYLASIGLEVSDSLRKVDGNDYKQKIHNINTDINHHLNQKNPDQEKIKSLHNDLYKTESEWKEKEQILDNADRVLKNAENNIIPDKLEKTSRFLDKHATATGATVVGVPTAAIGLGGGKILYDKYGNKVDSPTPQPTEKAPEKSHTRDNYISEPTPVKHPDPTFLEKHANSLSLAGGAAAAGLGAYALKKYMDKKKAKK
jgi:hypothetical protein